MRYEIRVTAYDVMDSIHVALVLYGSEPALELSGEVVLTSTTTVRGTGESDPSEWARDALVAALETL